MRSFRYDALPGTVIFGSGSARSRLAPGVEQLGGERVLVIATERELALAQELSAPLGTRVAGFFTDVLPHVPAEVAVKARKMSGDVGADVLLSVGGGSTTGAAKIVALETGLPIVAVPTTYAGSEVTPVWGMTTAARKETGRDLRVLPRVVVYDSDLVGTLPRPMAIASALNAMAHCVEALWTPAANPITSLVAVEGARALSSGLRSTSADGVDDLLYGAYLAGSAFAVAGSGLHHKICHALGGAFNLPHAETHAVVLPHVLAFNEVAPDLAREMTLLADALGGDEQASTALAATYEAVDAPRSLASLGMTTDQIETAVEIVSAKLPIANLRDVDGDVISQILHNAFHGVSR